MTQEKITYFFENLTQNTSIDHFKTVYDESVTFKDPFNKVTGIESVFEVFAHMYRNLDDPRFIIIEYVDKGKIAYVKWEFNFSFKNESAQQMFEGVSRLKMNDAGRVTEHIDYWDAAEHMYAKMPFIGWLIRMIKRRIVRN